MDKWIVVILLGQLASVKTMDSVRKEFDYPSLFYSNAQEMKAPPEDSQQSPLRPLIAIKTKMGALPARLPPIFHFHHFAEHGPYEGDSKIMFHGSDQVAGHLVSQGGPFQHMTNVFPEQQNGQLQTEEENGQRPPRNSMSHFGFPAQQLPPGVSMAVPSVPASGQMSPSVSMGGQQRVPSAPVAAQRPPSMSMTAPTVGQLPPGVSMAVPSVPASEQMPPSVSTGGQQRFPSVPTSAQRPPSMSMAAPTVGQLPPGVSMASPSVPTSGQQSPSASTAAKRPPSVSSSGQMPPSVGMASPGSLMSASMGGPSQSIPVPSASGRFPSFKKGQNTRSSPKPAAAAQGNATTPKTPAIKPPDFDYTEENLWLTGGLYITALVLKALGSDVQFAGILWGRRRRRETFPAFGINDDDVIASMLRAEDQCLEMTACQQPTWSKNYIYNLIQMKHGNVLNTTFDRIAKGLITRDCHRAFKCNKTDILIKYLRQ